MRPINAITTELADVNWSIKAFRRQRDIGRSDRSSFTAPVEQTVTRKRSALAPGTLPIGELLGTASSNDAL